MNHQLLRGTISVLLLIACTVVNAAVLTGRVVDTNGNAVEGAMVTVSTSAAGPTAWTVFSNEQGQFSFPTELNYQNNLSLEVSLRSLGYELDATNVTSNQLVLIARQTSNQAASAPASAWLGQAAGRDAVSQFVMECVGCHQVPASQFRNYASAIADIPGDDRHDITQQSWTAMVQYMNLLSAKEFNRGPNARPVDTKNVYSVGDGPSVINFLSNNFPDRMETIEGYEWGAPLAVTPSTSIREFEVTTANAIREALLLGSPAQLYAADVSTSLIYKIDPSTGYTTAIEIPSETVVGPHSLHRGPDDELWMAPFISSVVAKLDVTTQNWETWSMKDDSGEAVDIHDLSFGAEHTLLTDTEGNIWFSDVGGNAVGYLNTQNGEIETFEAPPLGDGRPANGVVYGLVMESDREHIWFSQLQGGSIGSFNTKTKEFGPSVQVPLTSGPRRLTISDDDIIYAALYGSGQLLEYDTRNQELIGIYDLPDTASAPYSATWDPVRKVVWVPTANGDVLYRFDPSTQEFAVLPLPREGALLRMVDIDPDSGALVGSYGNIVQNVHGTRMAFIIEPGDHAYD